MEYVSVLAGERFTDRPRCTHPALATVARYVNDGVGDVTRAHLVTVAPSLVRAGRRDPAAYAAAIVVCAAAGLRIDTEDPLLAGCASAATRRLRAITEARLDTARAVDRLVHTGVVRWRRLPGIVVGLVRARSVAPRRAATLRTAMMLSDDEQRTLDSTAALLAHDDPELAAALAHHTLPPRRRSWRPRSPGWPPLIVVALVLALLIVPGMIVDARDREPAPVPGATSGPGAPQSAAPPRSATPQEPIQMRTMAPGSSSTPASGS